MCSINNDVTSRSRIDRSRASGQCEGGDLSDPRTGGSRPLNLFQGDTLGNCRGSGLFPRQAGGCGGIEELLARLSKKDKNNCLDTTNAANGLFSGGKDFGSATGRSDGGEGGGGAGQALGQAMQGIQQVLGAVMNIVKAVMGIFGGL